MTRAHFFLRLWLATCLGLAGICAAWADVLPRDAIAPHIRAPMELGERLNDDGVWQLLNSGGAEAGYVFETEPMAPLPGFSGAPINMLVTLDLDGRFLDVQLLSHNEPIFVSGLGQAPFHKFFEQYRGHSITDSLVVGTPYGDGSDGSALVYLDGVTKATASVRIAHESLLAAALKVAREKMSGISTGPPAYPDPDVDEDLTWDDLVAQGLVTRKTVLNSEMNAEFAGTLWEDDDPEAQDYPDEVYLDFYVVDIGPPAIARAVLSDDSLQELRNFMEISDNDEPILVIETARHGLVTDDFIRNTAPDLISAEQAGFPVALRDADIYVEMADGVPDTVADGTALILRTDRRLGFDPAAEWTVQIKALREHGVFQPQIGSVQLTATHVTDQRFFKRPEVYVPAPAWLEAVRGRQGDLIVLGVFLTGLLALLGLRLNRLAGHRHFTPIRLGILAFVVGFIGWWGQGQLSIATPLGVVRTALDGGSFAFLLYDPFSLAIWGVTLLGFVLWGRGLFCGWLCPFGALQEFAHHIGRLLRLPQIEPSALWDDRLKWLKYIVLFGLLAVLLTAPARLDKAIEVEPFKTAITTFFIREWYYVAYAVGLLLASMVLFKGFCRYVCPLGAVMAIGGLIRTRKWIDRRDACGSPCQLCKVKCAYGAIKQTGEIQYSECFQCLDCVTIHDDADKCVPLIIAARRDRRLQGMAAQ
ncbi:4Fe-4S binding protein [Sulfitobacter sp. S190]|uniref:4Fe-4S binding protein n=1 Tax=Sulfitobacter sp. S190 TaxID=2867022 RepID=UPI0021A496F8|nr:4Fe-4S binding protein [Sulfitobacter sp. S190]UWR21904.1 4Fe-4S binding protein [Sulfitobacter sp. S190]